MTHSCSPNAILCFPLRPVVHRHKTGRFRWFFFASYFSRSLLPPPIVVFCAAVVTQLVRRNPQPPDREARRLSVAPDPSVFVGDSMPDPIHADPVPSSIAVVAGGDSPVPATVPAQQLVKPIFTVSGCRVDGLGFSVVQPENGPAQSGCVGAFPLMPLWLEKNSEIYISSQTDPVRRLLVFLLLLFFWILGVWHYDPCCK